MRRVLFLLPLALLVLACDDASPAPLTVTTVEGPVTGLLNDEGDLRVFRGVPYAAPPVGAQRFLPPEPALIRDETLLADDFGPSCHGLPTALDAFLRPELPDEDCLSLNIWTQARSASRPVMVWYHGGGYVNGSSNSLIYDGTRLARDGDVVVVTVNYRLGPLGFLATDALEAERASMDGGFGNMGLQDMVRSLEWIRDNIAEFGGDPNNVTVFGESAGASAVCHLVAAPAAQGLVHRAIMESGGCGLRVERNGSSGAKDISDATVALLGCDDPDPATERACLRAATPAELGDALYQLDESGIGLAPSGPVIDGVNFVEQSLDAIEGGDGAGVPFIIGMNLEEARLFNLLTNPPSTVTALRDYFSARVGGNSADVDTLIALYGVSTDDDAPGAWESFLTDRGWGCRTERLAHDIAAAGHDVFLYEFQHVVEANSPAFGVTHGFELPFVFGTVPLFRPYIGGTAREEVTTQVMVQAWTSFATDGAPTLDAVMWPATSEASPNHLAIDDTPTAETAFRGGRCGTLAALGL